MITEESLQNLLAINISTGGLLTSSTRIYKTSCFRILKFTTVDPII